LVSQPPKRYVSEVRDEQARRTRRAIVSAARELFVSQGYAATTIDAVAQAARVSRRTVFTAVGGKAVLLKLALEWAITGDDEPVAVADRPAVKSLQAEPDPRKALTLWVQIVVDIASRVAPIHDVLYAAADADPAAARMVAELSLQRRSGAAAFVGYLKSLDGLADGVTEETAIDMCWAIMDGHLYHLLVTQRRWTTVEFTRWLADILIATLLRAE
jgi:AcrR family transcriptional regulator